MFKLLNSITADLCLSIWRTFILQNLPDGALRWLLWLSIIIRRKCSINLSALTLNYVEGMSVLWKQGTMWGNIQETSLGKMVKSSSKHYYLNSTARGRGDVSDTWGVGGAGVGGKGLFQDIDSLPLCLQKVLSSPHLCRSGWRLNALALLSRAAKVIQHLRPN